MAATSWMVLLSFVAVLAAPRPVAALPATDGEWSSVKQWPISATHAHLLPTGRVLVFGEFSQGEDEPLLWNPATDTLSSLPRPDYNIFCSGHSFLPDGRLLVTGGHVTSHVGFPHASIFNPFTGSWSRTPDMNDNRWYPTNTTLPSGEILVTSGETTSAGTGNQLPQIYSPRTNSWRDLTGAIDELPYYPRQFVAPNGRVFVANPLRATQFLSTTGAGSWSAGPTSQCCSRTYGPALFKDGKVYLIGGADPPTATVERLDLSASSAAWTYQAPMSIRRRQHNATFLPDGKILVTGGTSADGFDTAAGAVLRAEVYDPDANTWRTLASGNEYRGYHSTALLLPDGRVFVGGGRNKVSMEVFSPPYLFQGGTRPVISSAPEGMATGSTFVVSTPDASRVRKVSLITLGTITHSYDENGRFLTLPFSAVAGGIQVTTPANNNLAPPGPYLIFLVDDRGVPSLGRMVTVQSGSGTVGPAPARVIAFGDVWKYNDAGVDPGSNWMQPAYADAAWPAGAGQLGYGDGDETTLLTRRSPVQPSYYFRKKFTLAAAVSAATIDVLHDDGVAVWVNGVQVFSSGMGNGLGYAAFASGTSDENQVDTFSLDLASAPLRVGENTIAVLVKQASSTSSDVSFALQLNTTGTAAPPPDTLVLNAPNGGERLSVGSSTEITWTSSGSSRATVDLHLSLDGGASWTSIATGVANSGQYHWTVPSSPSTRAMVRVSSQAPTAIADTSNAVFTITNEVRQTVIPFGAVWKYDDRGVDPGASWNTAGFNDAAWKAGPGQLGYGETDEATKLTKTSSSQTSVYFRRFFDLGASVSAAEVRLLYDDGVAIYVNGVLALSRNMDNGLAHGVYASDTEENRTETAALPSSLFVSGRNLIAVMVKQVGATSSDLSFDLSLDVEGSAVPVSLELLAPNGGEVLFSGSAYDVSWRGGGSSVALDLSTNLGASWAPIASSLTNTGSFRWTVPAQNTTQALVRVRSGAEADASNAAFSIEALSEARGISWGDDWKYFDSGANPGASWNLASFDDSGWPTGNGELGYGDGDETTLLLKTSPSQTSVYFRKTVFVDGAVQSADLHARFDDGLAVYVNGTLVLVRNIDHGLEHERYATASAENAEVVVTIPGTAFVRGSNQIAVMVKQNGRTSPDLTFDMQLDLTTAP